MGNYPRFFGKDASNLPHPTLFEMLDEAQELIALTEIELNRLETDLRFLQMMQDEYGR